MGCDSYTYVSLASETKKINEVANGACYVNTET